MFREQWLAYAELVNDVWGEGKEIIPLGHWPKNPFRDIGGIHLPGRIHGPRPNSFKPNETSPVEIPESAV